MKPIYIVSLLFAFGHFAHSASEAQTDLCKEYLQLGKNDAAIAECTRQIDVNPESERMVPSYINRGNAYGAKGKLDRAITDFNKAIELDPKSATAYQKRGFAYSALVRPSFSRTSVLTCSA